MTSDLGEAAKVLGTVKFFRSEGWGYIMPDAGGRDVYVHASDLLGTVSGQLIEGQRVAYECYEQPDGRGPRVKPGSAEVLATGGAETHARAVAPAATMQRRRGNDLQDWAYVPYADVLGDLASKALPENWTFADDDRQSRPYPILHNYLRYTFVKLFSEQKVVDVSSPGKLAAFNTGLVDRLYEPIFAVFGENRVPHMQPWCFRGFCIPGERGLGKELVRHFNPLPGPARYFDAITDLLYTEPNNPPRIEWNHVILDGVRRNRLPVAFLEEHAPKTPGFRDPRCMSTSERDLYLADYAVAVEADLRLLRAMKSRVEEAVKLALKRVQWNFKTAIPMWFPTTNKMSLLLPLAIMSEDHVDVALVVEKTESGNYLGHTILPLHLAYMDARLVCRPDSDWLVPDRIELSAMAEEDEGDESSAPQPDDGEPTTA